MQGYHGVWNSDHSVFICEPDPTNRQFDWVVPVAVVLSVTCLILLAAVALVVRRRIQQRENGLFGNSRYGVTSDEPATTDHHA